MTSEGDRVAGTSLAKLGGKGLFIKDLEAAVIDGSADLAVHSMKDVPTELPASVRIGAVLERADARDVFLSVRHATLAALPDGARLGSSSLRRQSQLRRLRPWLDVQPLRGNVDTRLRQLDGGRYAGILLAAAGLDRLGLSNRITQILPCEVCLPAVGQGIIGVECRAADERVRELLAAVDDRDTRACLRAERAFAAALGASCLSPIAGFATIEGSQLRLRGYVGMPDGSRAVQAERAGGWDDAERIGRTLASTLLATGGADILRDCDAL